MAYRTWTRSRGNRLPAAIYDSPRAVHVIIGTAEGVPMFEVKPLAEAAFQPLVEHPLTLAATILPDHAHWLLLDSRSLSSTVGRYKSLVTARARAKGFPHRIWQRSFWDHIVRDTEKLDRIVRYILENPIRAGLCERFEDYPYTVVFPDRLNDLR